jgi:tRNA threonylcarbamoyladenosine biosynthesis protein TsaE
MQRIVSMPALDQCDELKSTFQSLYADRQVFAFRGDLGAGKTTLIKILCADLGVEDEMSSPSFSLVNEYEGDAGTILHLDLYRLKKPEELIDIGWYDYLDQGHITFVEWPEMAEELMPADTVDVRIQVDPSSDARTLTLTYEP